MKKALAILSVLTFASASQSGDFLSDNELRIRPISYNPAENFLPEELPQEDFRGFPTNFPRLVYVDDELYARPNLVKNWHYPLPPLPMTNPHIPSRTPVQNQPKIEGDPIKNPLFKLGEMTQQKPVLKSNMRPDDSGAGSYEPPGAAGHPFYLPPHHMKSEYQRR